MKKVAVLLDGGFVVKRLRHFLDGEYPEAAQILEFAYKCVAPDEELFRIYYYDPYFTFLPAVMKNYN